MKTNSSFKLSQATKRMLAVAPAEKRAALKKAWVEGEANAAYKPKKVTGNRIAGADNAGDF